MKIKLEIKSTGKTVYELENQVTTKTGRSSIPSTAPCYIVENDNGDVLYTGSYEFCVGYIDWVNS